MNAVVHRHFSEIEGTYAIEAGDVDAVLIGVRPPLVMGVDAALRAEMVLRRHGVELVGGERFAACENGHAVEIGRDGDGAAHPAIGAGTAARRLQSVRKYNAEAHGSAMAGSVDLPNVAIRCHYWQLSNLRATMR